MSEKVEITESHYYVNNTLIALGIADVSPMRIDIRLPDGADWKTPYDELDRRFKMYGYRLDDKGRSIVTLEEYEIFCEHSYDPKTQVHKFKNVGLVFNQERSIPEIESVKDRLITAIREVFTECNATVEYKSVINKEAAHALAERRFAELEGKKCTCKSSEGINIIGIKEPVGKLIRVPEKAGGETFAFKPLRSRKHAYLRSDTDVCLAREVA